jgi:Flp pilus assembly protein TadG
VQAFPKRSLLLNNAYSAQAVVEFAVILPVLLLLVLGMFDLGRAFTFGVATTQGAREGARYATHLAVNVNVSDTTVVQRLIDASAPALQGCQPLLSTQQTCGGGTWTFTVSATPPGSGTAYPSIAQALAHSTNPYMSGGQITVTANGSVALLGGYCMGQSLCLPSVGVQGQASMEFV